MGSRIIIIFSDFQTDLIDEKQTSKRLKCLTKHYDPSSRHCR